MLPISQITFNVERFLMEKKDELRLWLDWALRGIIVAMLGFAVSYLSSISQDIGKITIAIVELRSENKSLSDRMDYLGKRVDRLENTRFFKGSE